MERVILGTENECYICGTTQGLSLHHIYGGGRRQVSDRYGAVVKLCAKCHTGPKGAHSSGWIDKHLKREAQKLLMRRENWTVDNFISEFGRSYL